MPQRQTVALMLMYVQDLLMGLILILAREDSGFCSYYIQMTWSDARRSFISYPAILNLSHKQLMKSWTVWTFPIYKITDIHCRQLIQGFHERMLGTFNQHLPKSFLIATGVRASPHPYTMLVLPV